MAECYTDDDVSAWKGGKRPAYQRMLADIASGDRDAVIVWHLDRLHRRMIELEQFVDTCSRAGVSDVVTLHGDVDLGNGDGLLVARIMAAVAANESDAKRRRGQRKSLEVAESGAPHMGGPRSFGFEADKRTHRPDEAAVIRTLAGRALAGESVTSLGRWLDETGVRTTQGKTWRSTTVRQLLISPRISGLRVHQGTVIGAGDWGPIIDPADGERLRLLLTDPARRTNRTARRYLLSGMCRCGRCGTVMYSVPRFDTRRYLCRSGHDFGGCGRMAITAELLETWVAEAVLYRLDTPAMTHALAGTTADDAQVAGLGDAVSADTAQLEDLARLWADAQITRAEWAAARPRIESRLERNRRTLARLTHRTAIDTFVGHGDVLRGRWEGLNLDRQVAIIKAVMDHVVIHPATRPGLKGLDADRVEPVWRL